MTGSDARDGAKAHFRWKNLPVELQFEVIDAVMRSDPDADKTLLDISLVSKAQQGIVAETIRHVKATLLPDLEAILEIENRTKARETLTKFRALYDSAFIQSLVEKDPQRPDIGAKIAALLRQPNQDDRLAAARADLDEQLDEIEHARQPTTTTEELQRDHGITNAKAYNEMLVEVWTTWQEGRSQGVESGGYRLSEEIALSRLFDSTIIKDLEKARNEKFKQLEKILGTGSRSEARAEAAAFIEEFEEAGGSIASTPPHLRAKIWALEKYPWLENRLDAAKIHLVEHSGPARQAGYLHGVDGTPNFARAVGEWFDTYVQDAKEYLRVELGGVAGLELTSEDIQHIGTRFDLPSVMLKLDSMRSNAPPSRGTESTLLQRDSRETAWARHSGDPRTEDEISLPYRSFSIVLERERVGQERSKDGRDGKKRKRDATESLVDVADRRILEDRKRDRSRSPSR